MAPDTLTVLLKSLTSSLTSATSSLSEATSLTLPNDGISLLDTKNELLLSYLHNLVFLVLLKLKRSTQEVSRRPIVPDVTSEHDSGDNVKIQHSSITKLVELRLYLEKGIKPLENRLKYQIDKVVQAATNSSSATRTPGKSAMRNSKDPRPATSDTSSSQSSDGYSNEETAAPAVTDLSYRPNPSALLLPSHSHRSIATSKSSRLYQPPRITPTAPPTATKAIRKPPPSATLNEYLATEHSTAPVPEPSIGTTIAASGRRNKSAKEREGERQRREYEEGNYTRLPMEGTKKGKRQGKGGWGGEDWMGLSEGAGRVEKLVGGKRDGALERSRKRGREDGGGGARMGESWEKRRRQERRRKSG